TATSTTHIYPLSLHDALPIYPSATDALSGAPNNLAGPGEELMKVVADACASGRDSLLHYIAGIYNSDLALRFLREESGHDLHIRDRKSSRLNSSHDQISYAVF